MKTIRVDLSNEGRLDILERTMSYRGGRCMRFSNDKYLMGLILMVGYSQEV
jgi:hypothetical protein